MRISDWSSDVCSSDLHIPLHQPHARGGLDVESAAVEGDALTDQRDTRMFLLAPGDLDQPRGVMLGGGAADRVDHRIALFERLALRHRQRADRKSTRLNSSH